MSRVRWFTPLGTSLLLAVSSSRAVSLPSQAQSKSAAAQCYSQAISFGSSRSAKRRAAYLCTGATSLAPAQCYRKALSFGANNAAKRRAAYLCRNATSIAPAECYWEALAFGDGPWHKRLIAQDCVTQPPITIPREIQDCVKTYQSQLGVSPSSALNACVEGLYE